MAVDWRMGVMQQNPGEAFVNAFQQGRETGRMNKARAAMAALVKDPNNTGALSALAEADPETAMAFRKQQLDAWKQQHAQHQEDIVNGARILRQFNPKDQQTYTQALAAAQQSGIDISQVPQQYNPEYVQGVIQLADALKPDAQDPGMIREFDEATSRGLIPQGTTYLQYVAARNPQGMSTPVTIPYNSMVTGGGGQSDPMPTVTNPDEAAKLPPGTQFRLPDGRIGTVPGGAGGNASGGFPS